MRFEYMGKVYIPAPFEPCALVHSGSDGDAYMYTLNDELGRRLIGFYGLLVVLSDGSRVKGVFRNGQTVSNAMQTLKKIS